MLRPFTATVTLLILCLLFWAVPATPEENAARLGPSVRLLLASRARLERFTEGTLLDAASRDECPVTIRFARELDEADIAQLEAHGVTFERLDGTLCRFGTIYGAALPWHLIDAVGRRPDVEIIESVWRPRLLPCLDLSTSEIQ
ncbi:MAG: hypothetical protein V2A71_06740, partial [Candidatus Eisenbacteria bacterium]